MITFKCPSCNAEIETNDVYAGQKWFCPNCGKDVTISSQCPKHNSITSNSNMDNAKDTFVFKCPRCQSSLEAIEKDIGKWIRCPHCDHVISIRKSNAYSSTENRVMFEKTQVPKARPLPAGDSMSGNHQNQNLTSCPDCGGMVSIHAGVCPHCGAPLLKSATLPLPSPSLTPSNSGMKKCPTCGALVAFNANACPKCGRIFRMWEKTGIGSTGFIIVVILIIAGFIWMGGCAAIFGD